ncbi:MAG: DNA repair protein RecN, partial [Coxiellaceae bacterium]|nr:DNA repair protein RecN [Coxiellaceae bacterium]
MLTHIHIKNFTIIDSLTLDFQHGLSVLTGETGAGKSIWVDAVNYALGARADNSVIRHGETRCEITLCFDVSQLKQAQQWLNENDYNEEGECYIRRVIAKSNPSRATINGRPCPLQLLRELGSLLLNIHGQHENQALLKRNAQQQRIDTFAGNENLLLEIGTLYQHWKSTHDDIEQLRAQAANRDAELNLLRYQSEELENLALKENEWAELSKQHQQLHNAKDLITQLNQAIELTIENEDYSASQLLHQAIQQLNAIQFDDPQIKAAKELLNTAAIHLQEAGDELYQYRDHLDLSPENLAAVEERLTKIHDLARKHHINPESLIDIQKSLAEKLQTLENVDVRLETLEQALKQHEKQYQKLADQLTASRKKAIKTLEKSITESIQTLGIEGGGFRIALEKQDAPIHPDGQERLSFEVCTNPGQPFQALTKVVSGGELSRISLALQVLTAKKDHTPTM